LAIGVAAMVVGVLIALYGRSLSAEKRARIED
jgi:hypothetical protein